MRMDLLYLELMVMRLNLMRHILNIFMLMLIVKMEVLLDFIQMKGMLMVLQ